MFKKKENGFSLVELAVAAAIATALAVVAVSVVTGTATSVSEKGSSAAAAETCTISEALAKSGGDEEAVDCISSGTEAEQPAQLSEFELLAQTQNWVITNSPDNNALIGYNYIRVENGTATYVAPTTTAQADGPSQYPPIILAGNNKLQVWDGTKFIDGISTMCIGNSTVAVTFGTTADAWDYAYTQSGACGYFYLTIQPDKSVRESSEYYGVNLHSWYKTDLNGNIVNWVD